MTFNPTILLSFVRLYCRLGALLLAEQGVLPGVVHGALGEQRVQNHLLQPYPASVQEAPGNHRQRHRQGGGQGRGPLRQSNGEG